MFKTYKDKKKIESLGKNPQNYQSVHNESCVYKQKPIKMDDFNKAEEKEVKERKSWKNKNKKKKLLRKINFKKKRKNKKKIKKEMWNRLKDLNQNFKDIKEHKKKLKMSKQYLKCKYFL